MICMQQQNHKNLTSLEALLNSVAYVSFVLVKSPTLKESIVPLCVADI